MKFTQKQFLMAIFAVTLIASGCATPGGGGGSNDDESSGTTTNPVQVTKFNAFPNPAPAGNTVTFTLELENVGSVEAKNVVGRLWNPPFAESGSDSRTWRDENGGAIIGDNEHWERRFQFNELRGAQEGVETFAKPKTLRLTAPDLSDGQEFPYNFHAKYFYEYSTEGSTTITAMGNEQYRESSSSKSRSVSIDHNSAPVTLEGQLLSGNPIVFYDSDRSNGQKNVQFCAVVNNEGGGTVLSPDSGITSSDEVREYDEEDKNKVSLTVEALGSTQLREDDDADWNTSQTVTSTLVSGDQVRECFDMQADALSPTAQTQIGPINIEADYVYAEDTATEVTVNGKQ